ncbi:MAG TPA: 30S ribosomal protein S6 [Nitrospiria bacterium]|nr:30S ribosomal protein S6 [Nitrospiria bacterium]
MTNYESIFIARPNLSEEVSGRLLDKMKSVVEKNGGALIQAENWGKKRLAYEVKKERKGTYFVLRYSGTGALINELERNFRVDDSVLKFLTVKVPKGDSEKFVPPTTVETRVSRGKPRP